MDLRPVIACAALAVPIAAQQLTWAEGPVATDLTVRSVPSGNPTATPTTILSRVELLGIEVTNRTLQQGLRDDVARLAERFGVRRVTLPANGDLFTYRRDGGRYHGALWIDATGAARVVLELPGTGTTGRDAPFHDRLGVAPDGRHALAARLDGSVDVIRLDGRVFASTGTPYRNVPLAADADHFSLCVGRSCAWFATKDDRAWRLDLTDGATPVDITPPGPPGSRLKPEFAPSADGGHVAFLHGPQRLFRLYLAGSSGPAIALPPPAAKYEEPGYLPETPDGPRLLLNDDATQLLYVDASNRDETFVLDVSGSRATTHWTGNANFQPYIGVIILPVAMGATFAAGIGDPGLFDLHTSVAGRPSTTNLTRTAATPTAPWSEGTLLPSALAVTAGGTLLSSLAPSGGGATRLLHFSGAGQTVVAHDLRAPMTRGGALGAAADFLAPSHAGDVLLDGNTAAPVIAVPSGVRLSTSVTTPGIRTFVATAGGLRVVAFQLAGAGLFTIPGSGIDEVLRTPGGGIALHSASGVTLVDASGVHQVAFGGSVHHVLSGVATVDV